MGTQLLEPQLERLLESLRLPPDDFLVSLIGADPHALPTRPGVHGERAAAIEVRAPIWAREGGRARAPIWAREGGGARAPIRSAAKAPFSQIWSGSQMRSDWLPNLERRPNVERLPKMVRVPNTDCPLPLPNVAGLCSRFGAALPRADGGRGGRAGGEAPPTLIWHSIHPNMAPSILTWRNSP
eukprot:6660934-Prymnesium_polylepis.1